MTQLLTARSVAETLGVSTETILRWTRRGELPAIRLPGGAIRFREQEIETWLAARELQNDETADATQRSRETNNLLTQPGTAG